jgi:regulatory protein
MPLEQNLELALSKAMNFCAYQERCIKEVKQKLKNLNVSKKDYDKILEILIQDNYLNQKRFALSFVSGKFRLKKWGKTKIKNELIKKDIEKEIIELALSDIDVIEYKNCLEKLFQKKLKTIKGENDFIKKNKAANYLRSKGYETELIYDLLQKML